MTIYQILITKYQRLFTNEYQISTKDYVRNYKLFMQNKANFPHLSPKNDDFTKKQTQFKPIQTQFNPIQTQFKPISKPNKPNFTTIKGANFVLIAFAGKLVYCIGSYYDDYYSILKLKKMKSAKVTIISRVPIKMNRSTENEHFCVGTEGEAGFCSALLMEPDTVQRRNKPFECIFILLCALSLFVMFSSCQGSVMTGLDCVDSYSQVFQGKRIGIITNHTAYNSTGEYIVDVIRSMPDVKVTALFGPEHGLWGKEQDAIKIDNQVDPASRLQVYSLYGKTMKPTPEMLKDIDILIFDIQDIGARFYTYIYTMSLAMEAAAENGKRFVVLDRPNPINGFCVEGNLLEPAFSSFVGLYPIPARHGMTAGELAKMFNNQGWLKDGVKADLVIIPMKSWSRRMWYDQTGLSFIKTSPNMPNLETAAIYPGLCLLEGTNISEGRGTRMPFRQFGAPWIDSKLLVERLNKLNLPDMRFESVSFTPSSSKYKDQRCNGVRIVVSERDRLEPYFSGIRIINEIYRMYPQDFQWKVKHFDRLCGTSTIRDAITNRSSLNSLQNKWQAGLKSFQKIRKQYLIYADR